MNEVLSHFDSRLRPHRRPVHANALAKDLHRNASRQLALAVAAQWAQIKRICAAKRYGSRSKSAYELKVKRAFTFGHYSWAIGLDRCLANGNTSGEKLICGHKRSRKRKTIYSNASANTEAGRREPIALGKCDSNGWSTSENEEKGRQRFPFSVKIKGGKCWCVCQCRARE